MYLVRFFVLMIFVFSYSISPAQQSDLPKDSLLSIINEHTQRDSIRVNALIDIQAHFLVDDHRKGLAYIREAIGISRENDYKTGLGFSLNALGAYFMRQGVNDSALTYTLQAIDIFDDIGEDQNIYAAYNNLALIYKRTEEFEQAVDVYKTMLEKLEGRPKSPSFVIVYFNLASTYQALNDLEKYELWLSRMIDLSEELSFPLGIAEGKLGMAQLIIDRGDYEQALEIANSLIPQAEAFNMAQPQARAQKVVGEAYLGLNQYANANEHLAQSQEIYQRINDPTQLAEILRLRSDTYSKLGQWETAFKFQESFHSLQDSLLSQERLNVIQELQTKYETERIQREKDQTELENLRLAEQNRQSRNMLLGSFGLLFIVAASGFGYTRQQKLKKAAEISELELKETQKRLSIEQQKRQAELAAVRAQLNPHFIFNLMNSVQELNITGEKQKANRALGNISQIMRKTLAHSQEETISLKKELELVNLYLDAEKLRFEDRLNYQIEVTEDVEAEFFKIPPMLIQPYVENAVKHGIMHKENGGTVSVKASVSMNDHLLIAITDDGVGRTKAAEFSQKNKQAHNSFSMEANRQRINNFGAESLGESDIQIKDLTDEHGTPSGTQILITLPIIS